MQINQNGKISALLVAVFLASLVGTARPQQLNGSETDAAWRECPVGPMNPTGDALTPAATQEPKETSSACWVPNEDDALPRFGIHDHGKPIKIWTLYLNDKKGVWPSSPRLVVWWWDMKVRANKLNIFRVVGGRFVSVLSLDEHDDGSVPAQAVDIFPSSQLPGIIAWVGIEAGNEFATVICYVGGHFKTVFKGNNVYILDIDMNGYPEIYSQKYGHKEHNVHTWDGSEYVLAAEFEDWNERYSSSVLRAVRDAGVKPTPVLE